MNIPQLYKEKNFLNHQFPTVKALNDPPTSYEGMLRCEKGKVKKLAEQNVWPFTQYLQWQKFRMDLHEEFPVKPPLVTWITDISHPNIVPNVPGAVCVSVVGEGWKPNLRLVSVVNSLYYLLSDPNPNNVFNDPRCLEAAKVCSKHGFPMMSAKEKKLHPADISRFNIIPLPSQSTDQSAKEDIVKFTILKPKRTSN